MTVLAETAAAAVSSVVTNVFDLVTGRHREDRRQRRAAADRVMADLSPIIDELRLFASRRRTKRWKKLVRRLYATLDELEPVLPHDWRHLKRSLRDCLGNAVGGGVAFIDHMPVPDHTELATFSRWTMHAADYLDECGRTIRRWGFSRSSRDARRRPIPTFDSWVRHHQLHT